MSDRLDELAIIRARKQLAADQEWIDSYFTAAPFSDATTGWAATDSDPLLDIRIAKNLIAHGSRLYLVPS